MGESFPVNFSEKVAHKYPLAPRYLTYNPLSNSISTPNFYSFPPQFYPVPVKVNLFEHRTNLQVGFWPGCLLTTIFGPLGIFVLLIFPASSKKSNDDVRLSIAARGKYAGALCGISIGFIIIASYFVIPMSLLIDWVNFYYPKYDTNVSTQKLFWDYITIFGVVIGVCLIIAALFMFFGRKASNELKKQYNIEA
ncbi:hypothetical protein HK096_010192 [Nowakowskiella sp. JEL0078]|nr:hypothetical protein HK096_010192 [Nowakowskiella sp. JEL0078]